MRLIDADKIQEYLLDKYHGAISDSEMKIYQLLRLLDEQPTIETLPVVRGEWIESESSSGTLALCNCCNYPVSWWHRSNFCPSCGADMKKE